MTAALWIRPPAKVNLWLRVLGRRADGYHELDTVFHALDLCDELVAVRTDRVGAVELDIVDEVGSGLPVTSGDDNLVVRAARAVLAEGAPRCGLAFRLVKRIPAGGGLGGGSSDAAAALRLAAALSGVAVNPQRMRELARGLGADVPFFLVGGTCRGRGVGEQLEPLPEPPRYAFLLLVPPFGTSTPAVFRELGLRCEDAAPARIVARAQPGSPPDAYRPGPNDLMDPAVRCHPELGALLGRLRAAGVDDVRMSGSGSTLFVAERIDPGRDAATALRRLDAIEALAAPICAESAVRLLRCRSGARTIRAEESAWPSGAGADRAGESS